MVVIFPPSSVYSNTPWGATLLHQCAVQLLRKGTAGRLLHSQPSRESLWSHVSDNDIRPCLAGQDCPAPAPCPPLEGEAVEQSSPSPPPPPHNPFAPPHPEKSVTLPRRPLSLALPTRIRSTHVRPMPRGCAISPHQSTLIPPLRRRLLKPHAHPCYYRFKCRDRSLVGSPGNPRGLPTGYRSRHRQCSALTTAHLATCPLPAMRRDTSVPHNDTHSGITELRRTTGASSYEHNRMSQKRTAFASRIRHSRERTSPP